VGKSINRGLSIQNDHKVGNLATNLEAKPSPAGSNGRRTAPAAAWQSCDHYTLAHSTAYDESSLQYSQDRNAFGVPQHTRRNRAFWYSSKIAHYLRAVAHGRLHRRGKKGSDQNQRNETPDKQDSPSHSAWVKAGLPGGMRQHR
jgi:hypothetical protein